MNLDKLDSYNNARPDGKFDFVEGYTIISSMGRIIFPVVEPFGKHLRKAIGNNTIADKYVRRTVRLHSSGSIRIFFEK